MFDMAPFKAPGPDGLHATFFQRSWGSVGNKVTRFAQEFFPTGDMLEGINDTSIVLIPKVHCPETVKQMRPIFVM